MGCKIVLNAEQTARFLAPLIEEIQRLGVDHFKKQKDGERRNESINQLQQRKSS